LKRERASFSFYKYKVEFQKEMATSRLFFFKKSTPFSNEKSDWKDIVFSITEDRRKFDHSRQPQ
jgi:hypothetical protein